MENLKKGEVHSVSAGQSGKLSSLILPRIRGLNIKKMCTYVGELVSEKLPSCWEKLMFDLGDGRMFFKYPWGLSSTKAQLSVLLLKRMLIQLRRVL